MSAQLEKFTTGCDRVMAFSFYALIYFLPISIALSEIFTTLALVSYLVKRFALFWVNNKNLSQNGPVSIFKRARCFLASFKPISNPLNTPIAVFLFVSIISVIFSQYRQLSINGFLGKTLQSVFIYFNYIECINTKKRLRIFFSVYGVSYLLICINGLYQLAFGHGFIFGHLFDGRMASSLRHANDFGAYLVMILPVFLFSSLFFKLLDWKQIKDLDESPFIFPPKLRIAFGFLVILGLTCFGFTYSRGAWVGFFVGLLAIGIIKVRNIRFVSASIVLIFVFLSIFYIGMANNRQAFTVTKPSLESEYKNHVWHFKSPDDPTSAEEYRKLSGYRNGVYHHYIVKDFTMWEKLGLKYNFIGETLSSLANNNRVGYWKRSLSIIKDYPLFGSGLNTYALVEGRYSNGWGGYPHNSYLQMMAETGICGIVVFLWLLVTFFRASFSQLIKIKNREQKILLIGLLAGFLSFLIHSFFDTNYYSVQLNSLMWVIMGAILMTGKIETN